MTVLNAFAILLISYDTDTAPNQVPILLKNKVRIDMEMYIY